ncbi:lateral signaling target protein 2 homolog isoform X1 [Phascolarctos cinereus]|uniref:Lateral signaling target protein 2 homolog isoform X1 n=1 Tax=Phascolarctos cinereus TaxID=38626 RepID=A0A6P5LCU1_PHACI|nr:lateral signaling target protein 2 homolog isoform X1 [Phascolarctos cinereus]
MLPAAVRKWLNRPKRSDPRLLAQFFFADERVTQVVTEIICLDVQEDPQHYLVLLNQLHASQEQLLAVMEQIMEENLSGDRRPRDYVAKFPEELLGVNLGSHVLFAAECLVAGSFVEMDETAQQLLQPLARDLLLSLEQARALLREQSLGLPGPCSQSLRSALLRFDNLFADFEFNYVAMVAPLKSPEELEQQQEVAILFCEAVARALKLGYLTQEMIDSYEPSLMLTIPRLAIISGLLIHPEGPLSLSPPGATAYVFSPFRSLLQKIQALLVVLSADELFILERNLCVTDAPWEPMDNPRQESSVSNTSCQTRVRTSQPAPHLPFKQHSPPSCPGQGLRASVENLGTKPSTSFPWSDSGGAPCSLLLDGPVPTGAGSPDTVQHLREPRRQEPRRYGAHRRVGQDQSVAAGSLQAEMGRALRASYPSPQNMLHSLFVCISGVADQLQTNFASELRAILHMVFLVVASKPEPEEEAEEGGCRLAAPLADCTLCVEYGREEPPAWVPDHASFCCTACQTPFSLTRRRHHCRNCGKIFCSRCSSKSVRLPWFGYMKPVRVCAHCYAAHVVPGCS